MLTIVGHGPLKGFKVAPRKAADIDKLASGLRAAFGITGCRFDAEGTLEKLTSYGVTLDVLDDNDPDLPRGVEACWVPDTVTLIIRESVYNDACRGVPRALFTVAHELGHLALGHRRTFNRDTSSEFRCYEDSEWQANTFAGAFLMPLALIKEFNVTTVSKMMITFGVSAQAAKTRITKLSSKGLL